MAGTSPGARVPGRQLGQLTPAVSNDRVGPDRGDGTGVFDILRAPEPAGIARAGRYASAC